ncbi:MAG: hypothetical protein ACF8PG_15060 [Maioricimonas sp. JB045]|uniref:hypothetical protein n=1 Tax=Maioricimonas sp. JC845 TaxID=3232138 RepID=UPI003458B85E
MKTLVLLLLTVLSVLTVCGRAAADPGELIFEDHFERSESQELKDEPGNGWTTSSDKTAGGHKQVDLRDGTLYIDTHATANHATSVRHEFHFNDGSVGLRFMLHQKGDSLKLNFADLKCRTVHAGHLFDVVVSEDQLVIEDRKTGVMDLTIRAARQKGTLTDAQRALLKTRRTSFPISVRPGEWHTILVHVDGEQIVAELDGKPVGRFSSEGFAHPDKSLLRLLVPQTATVDDVRIWRRSTATVQDDM